jgi:hypothetical protein
MPKLSDKKIEEIIKAMKEADNAINILERANKNSILFPTTKTALQQLTTELSDRYIIKKIELEDEE